MSGNMILSAQLSWWSGWCTDLDSELPKLAELGGVLLDAQHALADHANCAYLLESAESEIARLREVLSDIDKWSNGERPPFAYLALILAKATPDAKEN